MSSGKKTFILKPSGGAEGGGILLAQRFKDIPTFVFGQDYVAQEYLSNPLLIDNKKFDLRIYVLVVQLGSYPNQVPTAFIADEGLVRLCTENYNKPDSSNLHNLLSHLTNYSLNKMSENFVKSENLEEFNINEASKRPLSSVFDMLQKQNDIDTEQVFEEIVEVVQKSLIALQPQGILEQEAQFNGVFNERKGDCFQILGFDIFIDSDLKAWIIEINDHPSLNILQTKEGPDGLIKEPSEVDKYIKVKVVGDAIKLMSKKKHKSDRS